MTASSLRLSSQPASSPGDTTSASWRLPRLRHLPASPSASLTTMSVRPASLRPATRLDPMNPAPPVTNNIRPRRQVLPFPFAPGRPGVKLPGPRGWGGRGEILTRPAARDGLAGESYRLTPAIGGGPLRNELVFGSIGNSELSFVWRKTVRRADVRIANSDRTLHVDRRLRSLPHRR